jgi:ferritin-like metal-binding protein YciE
MATKKKKAPQTTLRDLLVIQIHTLVDVEEQIIKALPKMAKSAKDPDLRAAFTSHLTETKDQAHRLKEVLTELGAPKRKMKVEAIRGLVKDGDTLIKTIKDPAARDAMLIGAAQGVEHYEIAGYTAACAFANRLSLYDIEALLQTTLGEEQSTSDKLTKLASASVHQNVALPQEDEDETE